MMMPVLEFIGEVLILQLQVLAVTVGSMLKWLVPAALRAKSLEEETMVITGAGSGIGRLFARKFSALGVRVVLWDINAVSVEETARIVNAEGGKAWWYACDVTDASKVNETALRVKEDVGDVTMLVNNAGIVIGKSFTELTEEDFKRTLGVNSFAHVWTMKAFLPRMLEKNHGHIVTVSSIMGEMTVPGLSDYCMSKHASIGLHECVMREVRAQGKDGVHFTLVNPYKIDTGMFTGTDIKKSAEMYMLPTLQPEYVADQVVQAVQINQELVRAPSLFHSVILLYKLLPQSAILLLEDFLENDKAMDTFVGRRGQQTIQDVGSEATGHVERQNLINAEKKEEKQNNNNQQENSKAEEPTDVVLQSSDGRLLNLIKAEKKEDSANNN